MSKTSARILAFDMLILIGHSGSSGKYKALPFLITITGNEQMRTFREVDEIFNRLAMMDTTSLPHFPSNCGITS